MSIAAINWTQVNSEWARALTVIVPSVCTAAVALLIARWSRSHDFEKERRRRRQDFLEAVSGAYATFQQMLQELLSLTMACTRPGPILEETRAILEQEWTTAHEKAVESQINLAVLNNKLRLLGFTDCADKLMEFDLDATLFVKRLLTARLQGTMGDEMPGQFQFLIGKGQECDVLIGLRYAQL